MWSAPAAASSRGQEVVDLAAMAGLQLDPWQQFVLKHGLGVDPDGRWAAFEVACIVARQNGKGSILEALELAALYDWRLPLSLHTAHQFKTSSEHFLRLRMLIEGCDELLRRSNKPRTANGEEEFSTTFGSRLRFVARSTSSARGFTADLIVLDEAFRLNGDAMAALLPTLSSIPNPQVWYTSSAPLVDSSHLLDVQRRGRAGGGGRFAYFEWSADKDADPTDPRAIAAANPALGIRISPEFVEAERAALPPEKFGCERLGISELETDHSVIPWAVWDACGDPGSVMADPVVFAVDASPDRSRWSVAVAGRAGSDKVQVEVARSDLGSGWVLDELVRMVARWSPMCVVVDAGSAAGSLLPELAQAGIPVLSPTSRQVAQGCGAFFDAVCDGAVSHLRQPQLTDALVGARKRDLADAWAWSKRGSDVDITPLVAATLAHWGWTTKTAERLDVTLNVW